MNGPSNLANHQQFDETHTTFGLFGGFPNGTIAVQPFVRVGGPAGATATILHS